MWWLEGRVRPRVFVLLCSTRWFVLPCTPKLSYVLCRAGAALNVRDISR